MAFVTHDHLGDNERCTSTDKYKCVLGVWGSVGFGDFRKGKES